MKIILSILLLSFHFSFAQENSFALITEPQIGSEDNANNLIEAINHINKKKNISYVIVLGNMTASGKFEEFVWAQEILDGLKVPYSVVGGEKDYVLSEGKGSEFPLLFDSNKNYIVVNGISLLGINTILPEFPDKKYISIEAITSLNNKQSESKSERLITFSYFPISSTQNHDDFYISILNKKLFSFVSKENKKEKNISTYEGLYLNRKNSWGYLIVSTKKDSLIIEKILSDEISKKQKPEIVKGLFSKPLVLEKQKPVQFFDEKNLLWSVNYSKAIHEKSVSDGEKIYSLFKNGTVICLNSEGTEKWKYETNKKIIQPPIIYSDIIILISEDGDVYTINANTGNLFQSIGIGEKITSGASIIDVEEAGDKIKAVIVGTQYGNIYCYDLFTLNPIWTQQFAEYDYTFEFSSKLSYSNNKIFFKDKTGNLYCISSVNGMLIWKIPATKGGWKSGVSFYNSILRENIFPKNNNIYLIDVSGNLFCVDALLGTPKWNLKNLNSSGVVIQGASNEFIFATRKNKIAIVSTMLGKVTSEIKLPDATKNESVTDLILVNDKFLVGFSNGWVYSIKVKQKVEKLFRYGYSPIISLTKINGNCLVTDYDGNFSLIKILQK